MKRRGKIKQGELYVQRSCGRRKSGKYRQLKEGSGVWSRETKVSLLENEVGEVCRVHTRTCLMHVEKFSLS